jgi:hypothetical protein
MFEVLMLAILAVLVLFVVGFIRGQKPARSAPVPGTGPWHVVSRPLMNGTELRFYERLREALPELTVLAQVAMRAFLNAPGKDNPAWHKIKQKYCDFVVVDDAMQPVAVVEIDGPTHGQAAQRARDFDKDKALKAARVRVVRWPADRKPSGIELRNALLDNSEQGDPGRSSRP